MAAKINPPPYPTPIEIIRFLANAFGTKLNNKVLDEKAFQLDADYREVGRLLEESIEKPISKYISKTTGIFVAETTRVLIANYLDIVRTITLDGMPRAKSIELLSQSYFASNAVAFLVIVNEQFGGLESLQLIKSDTAVGSLLDWLKLKHKGWQGFLAKCSKQQKDKINIWQKGSELPSLGSIAALSSWFEEDLISKQNWENICSLLLIARAIDWCRNQASGNEGIKAMVIWWRNRQKEFTIKKFLTVAHTKCFIGFFDLIKIGHNLHNELSPECEKTSDSKVLLRKKLNDFKAAQLETTPELELDYWSNWLEARWQVYSGELIQANIYYKRAFDACIFRIGEGQKYIIEEALVVAASQKRPDAVFMKKLKNMLILLGFELPIISDLEGDQSYKASNLIEQWEIKLWKGHFKSVFPDGGLFVESKTLECSPSIGPLILTGENKPDFRNPNRTFRVGDTWTKKIPQLIWFCEHEKYNIIKKLLDKGADVNVWSESGDTPILMALEAMNITNITLAPLDDYLFNLLSEHKHNVETINKRTQKRRLLPIISAVQSGRVDIVKKIIEMGALPDKRGTTDNITPLMACLRLISAIKKPEFYLREQLKLQSNSTPELLDSIRRNTNGLGGFSLGQQKVSLSKNMNNETFNKLSNSVLKLSIKQMTDNSSLKYMQEIAKSLLEAGANPNAEHNHPGKGYTPLMYAVELDELELFSAMLKKGGDPHKTYLDLRHNTQVGCRHIAHYFGATEVMSTLKSVT